MYHKLCENGEHDFLRRLPMSKSRHFNLFCRQWGLCSANTSLHSIGSQGMTSILLHLTLMSLHIMNRCLGLWQAQSGHAPRGPSDELRGSSAAGDPSTFTHSGLSRSLSHYHTVTFDCKFVRGTTGARLDYDQLHTVTVTITGLRSGYESFSQFLAGVFVLCAAQCASRLVPKL